jgi:hypothetical protein
LSPEEKVEIRRARKKALTGKSLVWYVNRVLKGGITRKGME